MRESKFKVICYDMCLTRRGRIRKVSVIDRSGASLAAADLSEVLFSR